MTALFELTGAAILTLRWWGEMGLGRAAYFGLFHAVSAFNNAGFSLFSDNLVRYRGDLVVNLVVTALIVCGGLGFFVLREVWHKRRFRTLGLHAKLALSLTGCAAGRRHCGPLGAGTPQRQDPGRRSAGASRCWRRGSRR